jgi:hypothetical protein
VPEAAAIVSQAMPEKVIFVHIYNWRRPTAGLVDPHGNRGHTSASKMLFCQLNL